MRGSWKRIESDYLRVVMSFTHQQNVDLTEALRPGTDFHISNSAVVAPVNSQSSLQDAKILMVDDEMINLDLLTNYLKAGGYHDLATTTDSTQVLQLVRTRRPDLVLLDLMMPGMDGFNILEQIRSDEELKDIPVIILTASHHREAKLLALELGVDEFLAKPVDPSELLLRLRNTLTAKAARDQLSNYSARLEQEVQQRTSQLEAARLEAMYCLARAAEFRDDDTGHHVVRVGRYVAIIATALGFDAERVDLLEQAAQLHDVGKIGIPDSILLKPGKLAESEFDLMKQHCSFGKHIILPLTDNELDGSSRGVHAGSLVGSPIMETAAVIAETHHERWDGTGYPCGFKGEQIPIEGRITAVADVYDALSSPRPYKPAYSEEQCLSILEEGRGSHFDPQVLDAFLANMEEVRAIQREFADAALPNDA